MRGRGGRQRGKEARRLDKRPKRPSTSETKGTGYALEKLIEADGFRSVCIDLVERLLE